VVHKGFNTISIGNSKVTTDPAGRPVSSVLTVDLDLVVTEKDGNLAAYSLSYYNSYEIVEFLGTANQTYDIFIHKYSGTDDVWYGVAWTVFDGAGVSQA